MLAKQRERGRSANVVKTAPRRFFVVELDLWRVGVKGCVRRLCLVQKIGARVEHENTSTTTRVASAMTGSHFSCVCLNSWNVTPRAPLHLLRRAPFRPTHGHACAANAT